MLGSHVDHGPLPAKKKRDIWQELPHRAEWKNRRSTWKPQQWLTDMQMMRLAEHLPDRVESTGLTTLSGSLPYKALQHVGDGREIKQ
eukprot:6033410-Amphidinium_carterae.1